MRRLILSTLLLAAAVPALAQVPPPDVRDARQDDRRETRRGDAGPEGLRQVPQEERRDYRSDERHDDRQDGRRDMRQDDHRDVRDDRRDYRQDEHRDFRQDERRDFRDDRRDFRQDERRDFRDDRRGYGEGDRFARFRAERFVYPRGYGYRYYGVGALLPRVFWSQRYYIAQPDFYRLPPPFAGTHWVRVGPDAILVRNYDGRVVRVIQGLFY